MKLKTNHPLAKGLICSYLMNEGGGNKIFDSSGNQNHGTFTNSIPWGRGGIEPPGDNEHIVIPKFIDQDGDWTIFFSFIQDVRQPNSQTKQSHFMSMVDGGSGTGRSILLINDVGADTFKMASYIDGTENESTSAITPGESYTCGLTQDGTAFKFFLNGTPDGSFTATATACKEDVLIFDRKDGAGDACFDGLCTVFHWYDRPLTEEEMMWLDQDPYCMFEPDFISSKYFVVIDVTDVVSGKIIVKDSSVTPIDGLVILKDKKIDLLDGEINISDSSTDLTDGKVQVQDVDTDLADGKVQVQDVDTGLTDGLLGVQDKATDVTDGKVQIQDVDTDLADGKVEILDKVTGAADGLLKIKDKVVGIVDGKAVVIYTGLATNLADCKVRVKDVVSGVVDGKIRVSVAGSDIGYADGKILVKDITTGILDGAIKIKDVAAVTADGLLKIIESITSNVDGKLKIKDTIKNLADGKISIAGGIISVIRRLTIKNLKAKYRLDSENQKPTHRLETSSTLTTDIILSPSNTLYPSDTLYPNGQNYFTIVITEGS